MKQDCLKCGGTGYQCTFCELPSDLCDCFENEIITPCPACEQGILKGGEGRSAQEIQMAAENFFTVTIVSVILILLVFIATHEHHPH